MIAYNKESLENLYIQDQLDEAHYKNCVTAAEVSVCREKYPVKFYTPNIIIRIGLFILTVIIAVFSFGLITLMSGVSSEKGFSVLLIFFALISYAALELMVNKNRHYKSGVDDALQWMTGIFIISAFDLLNDRTALQNSILIFTVAIYLALRFSNAAISGIACVSFFAIIFFGYIKLGENGKATVPFLIMIISAIVYFLFSGEKMKEKFKYYSGCLLMAELISLLCLYAAGNYFVVREASISLFNLNLKENESISFGWLFWIFTIIIPLIYLAKGIQKKNVVLFRVGLLLIAVTVFTVRYYHHILPAETAMIIAGIALVICAYILIKYLKTARHGFTDAKIDKNLHSFIESLVIAQTLGQSKIDSGNQTTFGGGSGGGGGAGGAF
jgi:uncharacterized membrane protein YgcG